ncbi:MAG TPA: hypothetical protein VIS48_12300 [Candidatus Kryptonia bacterium]
MAKSKTYSAANFGLIVILFFFASIRPGDSQNKSRTERVDTLALVNGQPITSEDFKNRFDMSIYPGEDYRDTIKMEFLYSMIAEKLLSEAAETGPEPLSPDEKEVAAQTEGIFLRDALYRSKIIPRAKVSEADLRRGLTQSTYSYVVDALYFSDSISAAHFVDLVRGEKQIIYRIADSLSISHDTLGISYGESTPGIENAFFGHANGFISQPTFTVDGWIVFKVIDRKVNQKFSGMATEDKVAMIRKIIQGREETDLGAEYLGKIMKNVRVSVNYSIFRPLVYAIGRIFTQKHPEKFDQYYLDPRDMLELRAEFANQLAQPLLSFEGGDISLDEALKELPLSGFGSPVPTIPEITMELHSALRFISQNHFLSKNARELGLENSGEVKYNVGMFLDAYRSSREAGEITDTLSITQDEVDKFFETHHDEVLKAVQLKLNAYEAVGINEAVDIYDKLLTEKKAGRVDTSGKWTRASSLGEIGAVLAEQPDGAVYGPIFENGRFQIYKVIEKKSSVSQEAVSHSIEVAREMLTEQVKEQTLDKYISDLAMKAGVKIYYSEVRSVKITPIEMLTFRYIGFGGKILAVPLLYPREGWIKYYKPSRPPAP